MIFEFARSLNGPIWTASCDDTDCFPPRSGWKGTPALALWEGEGLHAFVGDVQVFALQDLVEEAGGFDVGAGGVQPVGEITYSLCRGVQGGRGAGLGRRVVTACVGDGAKTRVGKAPDRPGGGR